MRDHIALGLLKVWLRLRAHDLDQGCAQTKEYPYPRIPTLKSSNQTPWHWWSQGYAESSRTGSRRFQDRVADLGPRYAVPHPWNGTIHRRGRTQAHVQGAQADQRASDGARGAVQGRSRPVPDAYPFPTFMDPHQSRSGRQNVQQVHSSASDMSGTWLQHPGVLQVAHTKVCLVARISTASSAHVAD